MQCKCPNTLSLFTVKISLLLHNFFGPIEFMNRTEAFHHARARYQPYRYESKSFHPVIWLDKLKSRQCTVCVVTIPLSHTVNNATHYIFKISNNQNFTNLTAHIIFVYTALKFRPTGLSFTFCTVASQTTRILSLQQ